MGREKDCVEGEGECGEGRYREENDEGERERVIETCMLS